MLGLSLSRSDKKHIRHNITYRHDLPDNSVSIYQAEDVFEHINYASLKFVVKEIFRLLKSGGLFRLSVPDYNNPKYLKDEFVLKSTDGNVVFDPWGGGDYELETGKVINGGHIWFPKYETVKNLLETVEWASVNFLQYYDENKNIHGQEVDYSKCYVHRKDSMIID
jgi:SAM-dependent methyltransferase